MAPVALRWMTQGPPLGRAPGVDGAGGFRRRSCPADELACPQDLTRAGEIEGVQFAGVQGPGGFCGQLLHGRSPFVIRRLVLARYRRYGLASRSKSGHNDQTKYHPPPRTELRASPSSCSASGSPAASIAPKPMTRPGRAGRAWKYWLSPVVAMPRAAAAARTFSSSHRAGSRAVRCRPAWADRALSHGLSGLLKNPDCPMLGYATADCF